MASYSSPYYTSSIRDTMSQSKFLTGKSAFTPSELAGIVSGELEARYAGEARNRQQLLQERQQQAQEKATAWKQSMYEQQAQEQAQANTISGVGQVITGGMGIYSIGNQAGLWGKTATPTTATTATTAGTGLTASGLTGATGAASTATMAPGAYSVGAASPTLTGAGGATLGTIAGSVTAGAGAGYAAGIVAGKIADWKVSHKVFRILTGGLIKGKKTERRMAGAAAGAGAGAYAGSLILPGIGTLVGGVVGAVTGAVGGGKKGVVCSELNRQGLLPDNILKYDCEYCGSIDREAYYGYRMWGVKVANLMQKSKLFTKIVKPFGLAFAYESAHRINPEIKGNLLGKLMLFVGVPMCKLIYRLKQSRKEFCNGLSWSIR